jgi:hypothetical protein
MNEAALHRAGLADDDRLVTEPRILPRAHMRKLTS